MLRAMDRAEGYFNNLAQRTRILTLTVADTSVVKDTFKCIICSGKCDVCCQIFLICFLSM